MDADKLKFIDNELHQWADWIDKKLREKFTKMDIGVTDELLNSLGYQVFNKSGLNDGQYSLSFLEYGRMLDIGAGRGSSQRISNARNAYKEASENKIRKPKKWYSKTTYGGLNRLINALINGYQPAIINTVKENLTT